MGPLDAPVQVASFYVERFKLQFERVILEMALESATFRQKVPSHIFKHRSIKFNFLQVKTL